MSTPTWLVREPFVERELGILRSGKEAQVEIVERIGDDGSTCLLARKRYLPRTVTTKGTLEALGAGRASTFRHDVAYREGRQFRKTRDRRAVERMSTYGKRLLQDRWTDHEFTVMSHLHDHGVSVPFPVGFGDDWFDLEYLGDIEGAAPQLGRARLERDQLRGAWDEVLDGMCAIAAAGWAHGDLSAYNLLWWQDHVWFIDFPQAVDIAANPSGPEFLHRDVVNVAGWFNRHGLDIDVDEAFVEVLQAMAS